MRARVRWQVRLGLLLVTSALACVAACGARRESGRLYDRELARLRGDRHYRTAALDASSRPHRADTLHQMSEQNALLFQWSVLLLGGLAALVTTSKVHRIGQEDVVYVLLAPAAILLLGSLALGVDFQRRLTYLVSKDELHVPALNGYLFQQGELLFDALLCLVAFVIVFYLFIVFGETRPSEEAADAGKEQP
jgi:hypothetical protein